MAEGESDLLFPWQGKENQNNSERDLPKKTSRRLLKNKETCRSGEQTVFMLLAIVVGRAATGP